MAEVQWIKVYTNMFDISRKIKKIELMPQGDTILIIWFKLLTLAGKVNDGGAIYITQSIPYEMEDLVEELRRPEDIIKKALSTFEKYDMIERDNGFIYISSWEKYQNIEGMEKIREQNRKRVAKYRENKKRSLIGETKKCVYCGGIGDTVDHVVPKAKGGLDIPQNTVCCCLHCNSQKNDYDVEKFLNDRLLLQEPVDIEGIIANSVLQQYIKFDYAKQRFVTLQVMLRNGIDKEEDKEIDKDKENIKEIHKEKTTPQQIVDLFNSICVSFPSVRSLSEARKKAINARLNSYTLDDFKKCFEIAESSSFLKGGNDRNWTATFDWLIKDANMPKVLEGQYANKSSKKERYGNFDPNAALQRALNRSFGPEMHKSEGSKTAAEDPVVRERAETLKKQLSK